MTISYKHVKKILSESEALFYYQLQEVTAKKYEKDSFLKGTMQACYCEKNFVELHYRLTKIAEKEFNKELIPTYIFVRTYYKNSLLYKHSDRDQCEYSLTLNLGSSNSSIPWPIEFYSKEDPQILLGKISTMPGEGIFYKGIEYPHSRITPCPVEQYSQAFIHWVDKYGPYKDKIHQDYVDNYYKFIT